MQDAEVRWLSKEAVMSVPREDLPLAVLSFNYRSVIATLINIRRKSDYNHFMWMHRPGFFASQGAFYSEVPVKEYLKSHRLKFWSNPNWTEAEREKISTEINAWLKKPKLKTRYDWIAILGQLMGIGGIFQNPLTRICSDYGSFFQLNDAKYNLKHPAPDEVNKWLKKNSKYSVYGKYVKD